MNKRRAFILCGLIGSGKSTWAKRVVGDGDKIATINRDSIRTMFGAGKYIYDKSLESIVKDIAVLSVRHLLSGGYDVIIDETNLTKEKRAFWIREIKSGIECECSIIWFTESEKNLENRMNDPRGYSRERWNMVLTDMKKIFEPPDESEGCPIERISIS